MKNKITVFLLLFSFILPNFVFAAGISVSPSSLQFNEARQIRQITVTNPTTDVQIYEISPDDFSELFIVSPESFTLEAGGKKQVNITLTDAIKPANKIITTNLSVMGRPLLERRFTVNSGVKIPINLQLGTGGQTNRLDYKWLIIGILGAASILLSRKLYKKSVLIKSDPL